MINHFEVQIHEGGISKSKVRSELNVQQFLLRIAVVDNVHDKFRKMLKIENRLCVVTLVISKQKMNLILGL